MFVRFGDDLLSHVLRRSTIGATALNGRVRDGTGCFACAMITKPKKHTTGLSRPLFYWSGIQGFTSFSKSGAFTVVYAFGSGEVFCLSLDRIKPIGQLVPVN